MCLLKECKSLVILCIYKGINTMRKNENIIIRVDERLKDKFQQLTESNNMTMSAVLNACIFDMVRRNLIPMNIRSRVNALGLEEKPPLDIIKIKHSIEEVIMEANLQNKISRVYLFGSYSRGEANEDSDIDLRIEHINNFDLFDLSEMSYLLKQKTGKSVDIATQETSKMDPDFYSSIKKDEICLYERAR